MSLDDENKKLRHMSDSALDKTMKKLSMSSNAKEFVPKNKLTSDDLIIVNNGEGDGKYEKALTDVLNDDKRTEIDYPFTDAGYESHFSCGNISECAVNESDLCINDETCNINGSQTISERPTSLQVNTITDNNVYHALTMQNPALYTIDNANNSYGIYGTQVPSLPYTCQDPTNYVTAPVLQTTSPIIVQQTTPSGIGVYRSYHNSGGSSPHSYQSVSPPIITTATNGISATIGGEHYVMVHVNLGETFSIRVGDQIQNISGPATVRMVSNSGPPTPMPMQVPPGHMVQQIVDENGILTHVILSPLHQPNQSLTNSQSIFYPPSQNNGSMPVYSNNYHTYNNGTVMSHSHNMNNNSPEIVGTVNTNIDIGLPEQNNKPRLMKEKSSNSHSNDCSNNSAAPSANSAHADSKPRTKPRVHQYHHPSQSEDSTHYGKQRPGHAVSSAGLDANTTEKSTNNIGYSNHSHYSKMRKKRIFSNSTSSTAKHHYAQDQASSPASSADEATTIFTDEEKKAIGDVLNNIEQPEISEIDARSALIHIVPPVIPDNCVASINPIDFTFQLHFAERNPDSRYNCVFFGEAIEILLQDLKPATIYYVKVCCLYENITGTLSKANKFVTLAAEPNQPKPVQLQSKSRSTVQLKWSSPIENGSKMIDYVVEYCRADHNIENFVVGYRGNLRTCKISKLKPSTEYLFRLAAINSLGQSPWSDCLPITTSGTAPPQPDPPTVARADIGGLLLTWKKRQTDDTFCLEMMDEATGYGFITVFNGPEVEHYVENLRRNTSYRFHLAASNQDGRSKWSEVVTISTMPDLPSHPLKLHTRGKVTATQFVLVWDPPEDDGGLPVFNYKVELDATSSDITDRDSDRDWVLYYEGAERECQCKSLMPGTSVLARVSAKSSMGTWGSPCAPLTINLAAMAPGQMSSPRKDIGNKTKSGLFNPGTINLLWETPESDGGSSVTKYELCQWLLKPKSNVVTAESQWEECEEQVVYSGVLLNCQISGLIPGAQYRYRIRAVNKAGNGKWSAHQDIASGPSAPEGQSEAPSVICRSPHAATITWSSSMQINGSQVTEYQLEMAHKTEACAEFCLIYNGPNLSYDVKNLQPDSGYIFRVQATNRAGTSPYSPLCEMTTLASVPSQVTGVRTNAKTMYSIELLWKEPLTNGSTISGYSIEVSNCSHGVEVTGSAGSQEVFTVTSETNQTDIVDLLPDTTYKFRVQALNSVGLGPFSTVVKACTLSPPPAPPRLECINVQSNSIKLRWHSDVSARHFYTHRLLGNQAPPSISVTSHGVSEPPVIQYQLQMSRQPDSGWSHVYTGLLQFHKLGKLLESTGYYFRIMASNEIGDGEFSDPYLIVTEKAAPPAVRPPRVVDLTMDSGLIEWSAIRSMNYDPIVYILQLLTISEKDCDYRQVYRGSENTWRLNNLSSGTEYMTRVCAVRLCSPSTIESDKSPDSPIHHQTTVHELGKSERVASKSKDNSSHVTELLGPFSKSVPFTTASSHATRLNNVTPLADANTNCSYDKCDKRSRFFNRRIIKVPQFMSRWLANLGPWTDKHVIFVILLLFTIFVIFMANILHSYVK